MPRVRLPALLTQALLALGLLLVQAPAAPAKDLSGPDVALLASSLALLDQGKSGDARELAKGASDPLVLDLVVYFDLSRKGMPAAYSELAGFVTRHPDWPQTGALTLKAEAIFPPDLGPSGTAAWFDKHPPNTGQGAYYYVDALTALGRTADAKAQAIRLWRNFPLAEAQEGLFLGHYGQWLTKDDHAARLAMLLDAGLDGAAELHAPRAGKGYPELAAARIALQERQKKAMAKLDAVPAALKTDPGLLYDLARYYDKKDLDADLDKLLLDLGAANAGRPNDFWPLRFKEARRLMLAGSYKTAYRLARDNGLDSGLGFAELEWLAGYIALRKTKDYAAALDHFARYYSGSATAISKGKAAYWAALAAEALKQPDDARKWLIAASQQDTAFYGQLGAARLGLLPGENLPAMPPRDDAGYKALLNSELARAVRALAGAGDRQRTTLFFDTLLKSREGTAHYQAMGRLAEDLGRWDLVIDAGKYARNRGIILTDYLFPVPPLDRVNDPEMALVLALIRQESEFDQMAVSRAGAKGLMQLMPKTAKTVAKKLGVPFEEDKLTSDPDYNVQLGTTYLAGLLDDFAGSYILSLAGYNAGPNRANQWIQQNGDPRDKATDVVEWIEAIPFEETRSYVMRVTEGVVVYRHLLGQAQIAAWAGYNPASDGADGARVPACCRK